MNMKLYKTIFLLSCCFSIFSTTYAQRSVSRLREFYFLDRHSLQEANLNTRNFFFVKSIYDKNIQRLKESKQTVIWTVTISETLLDRRGIQALFDVELTQALQNGINGVFINVIDSKFYEDKKFIHLVRALRLNYPRIIIVTPYNLKTNVKVIPFVDFILVKGLFSKSTGKTREKQESEQRIKTLLMLTKHYPQLHILILEYANLKNSHRCKQLKSKNSQLGFISSITTPEVKK